MLSLYRKKYNQSSTEIADIVTNKIQKLRVRNLSTGLKEIVDPVIQRNSLFAHPQNILIAMITDDADHVRELELRRILKACHTSLTRSLQQFRQAM